MNTSEFSVELPEAVLWDMDGTIIDSEEYWILAETELVELFGGSWSHEDGLKLVGNGLPFTAKQLQESGVTLSIDEIIQALTSRVLELLDEAVPWRPGAVELMHQIQSLGIPQALVTMSIQRMARTVAGYIPNAPLGIVIAGDDVMEPKPAPEAYLLAAEKLGVDITHCVAIEDSPAGCRSAISAGAVTLGVTHLVSLDSVPTTHTLPTLVGVTASDVLDLFAATEKASR
ncbi:HAD superfamily hydrolase (TIGR01509 family) [Aurantimicrobium minutum]|uniref:HAD family hydrolase n=1 Tax=Aurantimicrobium minutum TaxID=708131 RepID=UPI0024770ED9|nr:HAD family phosphatase [Aurantimicrobium minutum]MDH6532916.1 HAD superfamily hydrolase (TIGR01509 family) [Aurantimicrobium minutum]